MQASGSSLALSAFEETTDGTRRVAFCVYPDVESRFMYRCQYTTHVHDTTTERVVGQCVIFVSFDCPPACSLESHSSCIQFRLAIVTGSLFLQRTWKSI